MSRTAGDEKDPSDGARDHKAASPRFLFAVPATLRPLAEDFPPIEELPHGAAGSTARKVQ